MTDLLTAISAEAAHEARRLRRRERLYVLLQIVGWGGLVAIQLAFSSIFGPEEQRRNGVAYAAAVVRVICIGWLLSHYVRYFIKRWGWHRLRWVALAPRVIGMAFLLAVLWTGIGFGIQHGLLDERWGNQGFSTALLMTASTVNGTMIFTGWLLLYFSYHAFDRFNSSEIERLRLEASVKDAELRALKAQVNPHFMFNALNSVRALIDENPARARQAVTQLANLLRYSLQSGALETVPFEDELRVVSDYLALEQIRYEERLRLRIEVAPDVLHCAVPPMLLQTLVENAVKYGIATRADGGEIAIRAAREDEMVLVSVTNPGVLKVGREPGSSSRSTGLGLRNAANRLRLLFGDAASLELRQAAPMVVAAEVRLPMDDESGEPPRRIARSDRLAAAPTES